MVWVSGQLLIICSKHTDLKLALHILHNSGKGWKPMMEFDFKGIRVVVTAEILQIKYKDAKSDSRTRHEREVKVSVHFWNFVINGDFYELTFVKSTLQYFMSCFWKCLDKEGSKIELEKVLNHENPCEAKQSLCFSARQKNKKHYLHIYLKMNDSVVGTVYLDGQEALQLDIAIGKAINLLAPDSIDHSAVKY
jgi:hypothetical protein